MPPVSETLWDRLHAERQRKAEQIAQMRAQRDQAELDECTFVPKLLSKPSASADGDVWDRLYKDTEETQVRDKLRWVWMWRLAARSLLCLTLSVSPRRQKLKEQAELEACTFKPKITHNVAVREREGNIWDELHNHSKDTEKMRELAQEMELEECTFKPTISKRASRRESHEPVWKRLSTVDRAAELKAREAAKAKAELDACTFKPEVSTSRGLLLLLSMYAYGRRLTVVVVVVVVVQLHQTSKTLAKASMVRNSSRPDVYERLQHPSPRRGPVAAAAAPPSVPAAAGAADDSAPAVAQV